MGGRTVAALRAALIGILAVGAPGMAIGGVAAGSTTICTLQPVVRDHTINQGVGSYAELTPGKDTLVRLHLSMPACAPVDTEMQLTSATITVRSGLQSLAVTSTPALPRPPLTGPDTNTYPPIASFAAAPMKDATGDPLFVVDGRALQGLVPDIGGGPLAITASIGFRYRTAGGAWTSAATTAPGSGAYTASVGFGTNPLRVLVVPMGDRSAKTQQFPAEAVATVEGGMLALSRMLPVPAGVGDLAGTSGGLRYRLLPSDTSLLDLGPSGLGLMGGTTPFCGKFQNFDLIQRELAEYLAAWNSHSDHQQTPADRVVGVVWEDVSTGPDTNSSCADGWGKLPGRTAWVRLREATTSAGSTAGALFGMELLHTWGAVSERSSNYGAGLHSVNVEADTTDPDRAYHLAGRSWLAQDRAVMRYDPAQSAWHEHNTLLEPPDWAHTRCALATTALDPEKSPCAQPGAVGAAPAGVQQHFSLAGTTDGTVAGTDVHSHLSDERIEVREDERSQLRLVQRDGAGAVIDDFGVASSAAQSAHSGAAHEADDGRFEISAVVPRRDGAVRFELWRGAPDQSGSVVLYVREDDAPPMVGAATTVPAPADVVDVASSPTRDEQRAAVTVDGRWVAWVEPEGIRVAPLDRSKAPSVPLAGTDPSWADDGRALVFTRGGDVVRVAVDTAGAAATFRDEYVVYDQGLHPIADPRASRPSVGPDGRHVALSIAGDLYVIDSTFRPSALNPLLCPVGQTLGSGPCRRLTATAAAETAPAWSEQGIFHERDGAVWAVDADGSGADVVTIGRMPAARGSQLVFVRDGRLWWRSSVDGTERALTDGAADAWPAVTATLDVVAFDRDRSGQRDVVALDASERIHVVTATDDHPQDLRLDVFLGAGDAAPVEVGLRPVSVSGSVATFEVRQRASEGAGGVLAGRVTDGWNVAWFEWAERVPDAPAAPVPSIHTPVPGSELLQFSPITLSGDARIDGRPVGDGALAWSIVGPDGATVRQGTGRLVPVDPPVDGWVPGRHEIRLEATAGGQTSVQVLVVDIEADRDRDGVGASRDRVACVQPADDDPTNFDDDADGDGIPTVEDLEPCTSASNGTADFEPDVYYVPAEGLPFSVVVRSSSVDLRQVTADTVVIEEVGRFPVSIPATSVSTDRRGALTVKFDRALFDDVLEAHPELIGGYVPVVVTGGPPSSRFRVRDATAPDVQPA